MEEKYKNKQSNDIESMYFGMCHPFGCLSSGFLYIIHAREWKNNRLYSGTRYRFTRTGIYGSSSSAISALECLQRQHSHL